MKSSVCVSARGFVAGGLTLALGAFIACKGADADPDGTAAPTPAAPVAAAGKGPAAAADTSGADGDNCDVTVEGPDRTKLGEPAVATVSLRATGGYKLNQEAPFSVEVGESELTVAKKDFSIDDASVAAPEEVQMEIPFSGHAAGDHDLEIHARFGVCSDDNCGFCRQKRKLKTVVD